MPPRSNVRRLHATHFAQHCISSSIEAILLLFRCLLDFLPLISYFCSCSRGLRLTMWKVLLFLETKQKRYRSHPPNPFCFLFDCWRNTYKLKSSIYLFSQKGTCYRKHIDWSSLHKMSYISYHTEECHAEIKQTNFLLLKRW